MKKINNYEVVEYTYGTIEERDNHVEALSKEGWVDNGKVRRMKVNSCIMSATDNDYEYYAHLIKYSQ
jgi:hypothetical protein